MSAAPPPEPLPPPKVSVFVICVILILSPFDVIKTGVLEGMNNVREIDQNLVDAQTARRVIERRVGYKVSPV